MKEEKRSVGGGIGFCGLLTIVFIVLKLCKIISWSMGVGSRANMDSDRIGDFVYTVYNFRRDETMNSVILIGRLTKDPRNQMGRRNGDCYIDGSY